MEEYIEMRSQYGAQDGITNEEMKDRCSKLFPNLKRWKRNLTAICGFYFTLYTINVIICSVILYENIR